MKCMQCGCLNSHVIDSRLSEDGCVIRRRRECDVCGHRFTTFERLDLLPLVVVKRDQTREQFDLDKLRRGIVKACEKRPVSLSQIDALSRSIEQKLRSIDDGEVTSLAIGEMVMEGLRELDEVSYVRFASVYRQFRDIQTFRDELNKLLNEYQPDATGDRT